MDRALAGRPALSAGLVLEDGFCKYMLLEKGQAGVDVVKSISLRLDTRGGDVHNALFSRLAECGAPKEVPIVYAMSFDETLIKIIDMPNFSLDDVKRTLRYQFDDYFPFTFDESNYDVAEITYPAFGGKKFMAAACRARLVWETKAGAEKAGFTLSCVEPAQVSFERAVTPADRKEELIEIYAGGTNVLFVVSNGKNGVFYRNAVVRQEGSAYIEKAAEEIGRSLDLARHNIPDVRERHALIAGPRASDALRGATARILKHADVKMADVFLSRGVAADTFVGEEMILPFGAALRLL